MGGSKQTNEPYARDANHTSEPTLEVALVSGGAREEDQEGAPASHERFEKPPVDGASAQEVAPTKLNAVTEEVRPKTKRFDFGPGFFTRCSTCGKLSLTRGEKDTRVQYCIMMHQDCIGCY